MTQRAPNQGDEGRRGSGVDELKPVNDNLQDGADQLMARQKALAEMEANYPHFRQFVYAQLRAEFAQTFAELPDTDLETLARQEEAQPLESFIAELELPAGQSNNS
jgi:hypothetical protein